MNLPFYINIFLWLLFFVYWSILNRKVKKNINQININGNPILRIRLRAVIISMLIVEIISYYGFFKIDIIPSTDSIILNVIGIFVCCSGIVIAIWSRKYLGQNWNGTPSVKEKHNLITSGPYRVIRHPIYFGILLATLGSSIIGNYLWIIVFMIILIISIKRIHIEEALMALEFPDSYPEYVSKTKALIPFIF